VLPTVRSRKDSDRQRRAYEGRRVAVIRRHGDADWLRDGAPAPCGHHEELVDRQESPGYPDCGLDVPGGAVDGVGGGVGTIEEVGDDRGGFT